MASRRRPKYLNLVRIKLPMPGVVSILHRASGALLFLAIPFCLLGLQATLASPASFEDARQALAHPLAKLVLIGLLWALLHHFFAGLRYLAMDLHCCLDLPQTRLSSLLVLAASLGLTLAVGAWLW